jgi:alpha-tubulin suppressor-like RCC1 family protein
VYGLVMNDGSNAQLDYGQVPDGQTFKAVYLDHGAGATQGQGLVMGGSGGASNSYVPSTMAIWARLDPLQVLALSGGNPVSSSGNYLLGGISTSYVDVIDFDASGAFSAETATGTIRVLDTSAPVIALIGANPLEIYKGVTFSDPGATVTDNADATRTITGSGTVNTATVGIYTLTYTATDVAGNLALPVTRTVNVVLDPAGDEDGDGLSNGAEMSGGTSPYQKDSDNDGVNDSVEITDGTNPTNPDSFNNLNKGLVAYYPFNGNANDFSGNGFHGTSQGSVAAVTDKNGRPNSSYFFPGSGDSFVRIGNFNSSVISNYISMSLWFQFQGGSESPRIFNNYNRTRTICTTGHGTTRTVQVVSGKYLLETSTLNEGRWYHLVLVENNSSAKIYLNGDLADQESFSPGTVDFFSEFDIGRNVGGNEGWAGQIDEVKIFNIELAPAQISQIYSSEVGSLDSDGDGLTDAWERGYGRYQIIPGNFTWDQAKSDAEARSGHLATITSLAEQNFVSELTPTNVAPWIGLRRTGSTWSWITGEPYAYTNWVAGQPEGGAGLGDVAGITGGSLIREWSDTFAAWNDQNAYVLEFGYPTDPTNADTDGDGFIDKTESLAGTDPNDATVFPDTQAPLITLIGADPLEVYKGATFTDPGATVTDNKDATRTITGSGTVNTATVGIYTVTYTATDAAGNLALPVTRTVVVKSIPATITLSTAAGSYTLLQGAVPLDDSLTVSGDETFSGATVQIETGFASGDTLNLTLSIGGITGTYDGSKGILTLSGSGSASAYQSALRAVTFSTISTSIAERGFKVTLGSAISFGGHYYEFVPGSHSWSGARTLALSKTFNGLSGYLANLTSADENSFVKTKIGTDVWIGGSDEGTEGVWKWMDGPEAGQIFWNGLASGSAPSGRYANWYSGEPNQGGDEDYAQFYVGTGQWNDLGSGSRLGFLVEYGTDTSAIQTFSGTRTFSVTKATPTITAAPTAAPISYGQTLGSSTLSGGSGSVAGAFAFTTPSTAPSVGTATQSVTFRPSDTANYNTVTTSVNVTVSRATPTINPGLSASAIAFGQSLSSSSLSGSARVSGTAVAGTFAFTTPSTAPNAGTASQNVTFTPTETANYNTVTTNVSVTVSRATPTINPGLSASAIVFGQTLVNSSLSGSASVNGTVVAGTFAFTTPSTAPNAGTVIQDVTFTPSDTANYNSATASVSVTVNAALISSGFSHTLYLGAGATTVTAWGLNTDGRLGVGDMNSPVNWAKTVQGIPVGVTVDALSAGGTHSLILAGGQVYAAGSDRFGQLGQGAVNGANKASFTPVVTPSSTPVAVAAGGNHSLIVTAAGEVFACGDNTYGQLAQPAAIASLGTWSEVIFPGLTTRIVSAAAGADHNLAVDENGGVWVWGRNDSGQLGKNTRTSADRTPVRILSSGAKSLAAGYAHSLILKQDGSVLGFGRNTLGQTGQSSGTSYAKLPIPIPGLSGIRLISAGTDSSFAIDGAGQLRSWGYNAYGELLLGNASPSSFPAVYGPTPSPIATNVFNVSGGGYSSLAVGAQGVIFGGRNDLGQAGNGPDPDQVVGDYYYGAGNLALTNVTMDLAGTTETLYDQIFVGSGTATLNGILNLMFVGTYSGPVYGSTQTFDLIWAKNGIVLGTGYEMAFNQAGYLVESAVADKSVEGVSGKVLQATIRAVVTVADLAKAVDLARPSLDGVESVSYRGSTGLGLRTLSVSPWVEMIYIYDRPTGGVSSGAQYFVNGITYRVEQVSSLTGAWGDASVSGTTVTPLGNGGERVTLRISSSGGAGFLRLQVENPQATGINAGVGSAITY